jgi:hypothetical protein
MPWTIGTVSPLSWSAARDKVRGDLWRKGTTGIPDDVVDRALHASILDVESRRNWQWLEQINSTFTLGADAASIALPAQCSRVQSLAVFVNTNPFSDPLELVPLQTAARDGRLSKGLPGLLRDQQWRRISSTASFRPERSSS